MHPTDVDTANIHLHLLGQERVFSVPIGLGRRTPLDLLPPARALTEQATAVAIGQVASQGQSISCRAGCGACCRQLVAISVIEAQALADLVRQLPEPRQQLIRQRFADVLRTLEAAGLLDAAAPRGQRALLSEHTETGRRLSMMWRGPIFADRSRVRFWSRNRAAFIRIGRWFAESTTSPHQLSGVLISMRCRLTRSRHPCT